jgi:nondiscriminating aspartyl-tRNA synthetase
MERTYVEDIKKGDVALNGWAHEIRDLAKLKFLLLRDSTGIVQCILKDDTLFDKFSEVSLESVVEIKGTAKGASVKAEGVRSDVEVEITNFEILNKAEELPIQVNEKTINTELPKRLDNRQLDIRKPKIRAIFNIQSTIINAFREYFFNEGFMEIQPPAIIATSTEGGTDLFKIKYFEKDAYLAQSPQLYKQLCAISLEKVFSTSAIWRAEKHDTTKHINEIRQMDIEMAFADDMTVMKQIEKVVQYIAKKVLEKNKVDLELLEKKITIPKAKYLTYREAIKLMNENGIKMKEGDDFEPEAERKLCELFPNHIVFTYEWPISIKPFYIWPKDTDKNISGGFDALFNGIEISSGGQRVHVPEILIQQLKDKGLKPKDFEWYVDAFRYGAPKHAGWSIGLERMTQTLLGLDNIRECTLFPRDRRRLTP